MTDKEKLEKLVIYLGRRMYAHNQMADIGSTGEIFDEKIENAKYEECRETLNFIDSLQKESKECMYSKDDFTKALAECIHNAQCNVVDPMVLAETWKDELIKLSKCEEPVSEDLEQAIDTYLATYFGGEKEKQEWPFLKKMAIHFAEWQKHRMIEKSCYYIRANMAILDANNNDCMPEWLDKYKKAMEE